MKKKVIAAAVAATLGQTAANAVSVDPNGLGQVLIYPYYTVQSTGEGTNFDTLITVVNTTNLTKAVKVRFIEAKASWEVLDFNLYLSPNDVWTGVIAPDDGGGARIITNDNSCTVPQIPEGGVAFRNLRYDPVQGGTDDGAGTGLDRTREGYIEIFDMGTVIDSKDGPLVGIANPSPFTPEAWALHGADGQPADCASLNAAWAGGSWQVPPPPFVAEGEINVARPVGGLFGSASLINVNEGSDYGYDATALADFSSGSFIVVNHTNPSSILPNLADVTPKVSNVLAGNTVITSSWVGLQQNAVDPVSAVLMEATSANDYVTEAGIAAATSFVYTLPTKSRHIDVGIGGSASEPFTVPFFGSACEEIGYIAWDREERTERPVVEVDFSPRPDVIPDRSVLCFEANVVNINETDVLGSQVADLNKLTVNFENGWLLTDFYSNDTRHQMTADDGTVYRGLPVVGFSLQRYLNNTLETAQGTALSNYGGLFEHKKSALIIDQNGVQLAAPARVEFPDNQSVLSQ